MLWLVYEGFKGNKKKKKGEVHKNILVPGDPYTPKSVLEDYTKYFAYSIPPPLFKSGFQLAQNNFDFNSVIKQKTAVQALGYPLIKTVLKQVGFYQTFSNGMISAASTLATPGQGFYKWWLHRLLVETSIPATTEFLYLLFTETPNYPAYINLLGRLLTDIIVYTNDK